MNVFSARLSSVTRNSKFNTVIEIVLIIDFSKFFETLVQSNFFRAGCKNINVNVTKFDMYVVHK